MDVFGKIDGYVDVYGGFDFLGSTPVVKKVRSEVIFRVPWNEELLRITIRFGITRALQCCWMLLDQAFGFK